MSLASHQIYNLHFYIIGLCLCCLLIVHPRLLIFSKWQSCIGKYFNKPSGEKKKNGRHLTETYPMSQNEERRERPSGDDIHIAEPRPVSVLLIPHPFNRISFQPGQNNKQRHSAHHTVPEQDIFSYPQKCIFPIKWRFALFIMPHYVVPKWIW